jgi:hypothetical protein
LASTQVSSCVTHDPRTDWLVVLRKPGVLLILTAFLIAPVAALDASASAPPSARLPVVAPTPDLIERGRAEHAAAAPCKDVFMLGLAGSGEQAHGGTYGTTIEGLFNEIRKRLPRYSIAQDYVRYNPVEATLARLSAIAVKGEKSAFIAGFHRGVSKAITAVNKRAQLCPREALVVAGYSQGAMVAVEALVEMRKSDTLAPLRRVAIVGLVANPFAHKSDPSILIGNAGEDHHGIYGLVGKMASLGDAWIGDAYEVCRENDIVCDTDYRNVVGQATAGGIAKHSSYVTKEKGEAKPGALVKRLGEFARNRIAMVPRDRDYTVAWPIGVSQDLQLQAKGGRANQLVWTADSAGLPPGLDVDSDGVLSGTLTRAGTWRLRLSVRNRVVAPGAGARVSVTVVGEGPAGVPPSRVVSFGPQGTPIPTTISPECVTSACASASADGRVVAFLSTDPSVSSDGEVAVVLADTVIESGERIGAVLESLGISASGVTPQVSPDGSRVVWTDYTTSTPRLVVYDVQRGVSSVFDDWPAGYYHAGGFHIGGPSGAWFASVLQSDDPETPPAPFLVNLDTGAYERIPRPTDPDGSEACDLWTGSVLDVSSTGDVAFYCTWTSLLIVAAFDRDTGITEILQRDVRLPMPAFSQNFAFMGNTGRILEVGTGGTVTYEEPDWMVHDDGLGTMRTFKPSNDGRRMHILNKAVIVTDPSPAQSPARAATKYCIAAFELDIETLEGGQVTPSCTVATPVGNLDGVLWVWTHNAPADTRDSYLRFTSTR